MVVALVFLAVVVAVVFVVVVAQGCLVVVEGRPGERSRL
jgi:hypothetical protein